MHGLVQQDTMLPPSVAGSALTYGWSLFGLSLIFAVSAAMLWHILREMHCFREGIRTPLDHLRAKEALWFLTFLLLPIGDIALLLAWQEVSDIVITQITILDRWIDGFAVFPFLGAAIMLIRSRSVMEVHLMRPPLPEKLYVSWPLIFQHIRIGVLVALLAAGIAIGKVGV